MKQLLNKPNKKGNKLALTKKHQCKNRANAIVTMPQRYKAWTLGKSTFLAICLIKNTLASIAWVKL